MGESYAHRVTYQPPPPGPYGQPSNPDPRYGAPYGSQPDTPYGQQPGVPGSGTPYGSQPPYGQQPGTDPYGYGAGQQMYGGGAYPGGFVPPPGKKKTGLIVSIVATVIILLGAGGAGLYFGVIKDSDKDKKGSDSSSSAPNKPGKLDAKNVVDLSKFDPCFVTPENFAGIADTDSRTQKPKVNVTAEGFNKCRAIVYLPGIQGAIHITSDTTLTVDVGKLTSIPKSQVDSSTDGPVGILKRKPQVDSQQCQHLVYQGDGSSIEIHAGRSISSKTPIAELCKAADIATKTAVAALRQNPPKQLSYPSDSFGNLDPCTTVTNQDVNAAFGTSGMEGKATQDKHRCRWGKSKDEKTPAVRVEASLEKLPKVAAPAAGIEQIKVAGRDSFRTSSESASIGASSCTISTAGKNWSPWIGFQNQIPIGAAPVNNNLIEYPEVFVIIPGGTKEKACQVAQTLAEKVWPRLPR